MAECVDEEVAGKCDVEFAKPDILALVGTHGFLYFRGWKSYIKIFQNKCQPCLPGFWHAGRGRQHNNISPIAPAENLQK